MSRVNLVYNPSFRLPLVGGNVDGWVPTIAASIQVSPERSFYGNDSLKVTLGTASGSGVTMAEAKRVSVTAGKYYSASAYIFVPLNSVGVITEKLSFVVEWYNQAGQLIPAATVHNNFEIQSNYQKWYRALRGTLLAPVGATKMGLSVHRTTDSTALSDYIYVDAFLVEETQYVGEYFDNLTQDKENVYVDNALTPSSLPTIGGMELNADIIIGDLILNTIDEDGTIWVCTNIQGWWGQPDPEIPDIPRGVQDGSYQVEGRYQARQMTLEGVFIPSSRENLGKARDKLVAATNLVRTGTWLTTDEQPAKASYVRLSGRPQIETTTTKGRTSFSIGLRAADPIKYQWDNQSNDGITTKTILAADGSGIATNNGTALVSATFNVQGPIGAGSTIYNSSTDETITLTSALRGARKVAVITFKELYNNVATFTTSDKHYLLVGDIITVSGLGDPYDTLADETYEVIGVVDDATYTVSVALPYSTNLGKTSVPGGGTIRLVNNDLLSIDTYERSVTFNGDDIGNRSRVDTLVDWIQLAPGANTIYITDNQTEHSVKNKKYVYTPTTKTVTLTTVDPHYIDVGEQVVVTLADEVAVRQKAITDGVATLTTVEGHGISVGDTVNVVLGEAATVIEKDIVGSYARITVEADAGAFNQGDTIVVDLSEDQDIAVKSGTGSTVTLGFANAHRFSSGDSIDIDLSTSTIATTKSLTGTLAKLSTGSNPHNFSIGDVIDVALPDSADITTKSINGSVITLTSDTAHGFSAGDQVAVDFPRTATLTGSPTFSGFTDDATENDYLVTLTTSAAHNYFPGESISVDTKVPTTVPISTRESSGTTRTLALSTAAPYGQHKYSVGEQITVTTEITNTLVPSSRASSGAAKTLTFSSAHNFAAGELINVSASTGVSSSIGLRASNGLTKTITTTSNHGFFAGTTVSVALSNAQLSTNTWSWSTTFRTLTFGTSHGWLAGETITVTGGGSRWSGTYVISSVTANSITYNQGTSGGTPTSPILFTVTNNTLASYNGTFTLASASGNTLTYSGGQSISTTQTGASGTVTNLTAQSYIGLYAISSVTTNSISYTGTGSFTESTQAVSSISVVNKSLADMDGTFLISAVDVSGSLSRVSYVGTLDYTSSPISTTSGLVYNKTIAEGYNGISVIESVPTPTTLTYYYYEQNNATTGQYGTSPTIDNETNKAVNTTSSIISEVPTSTTFRYIK